MGSGKHRWRISFHHRSSSPSSPPLSPSPTKPLLHPPSVFLCPLSKSLMADPVIVPSGLTFERAAIQACKDLSFLPPSLSSSDNLSSLLLIPNSALLSAILHWCDQSGHPRPVPLSPDAAHDLIRGLIASSSSSCEGSAAVVAPISPSSPSSYYSSSSYSSAEIVVEKVEGTTESNILNRIKDPRISEQESGLVYLRQETRGSRDSRISLCTPKMLAALRPLLVSRYQAIQTNAVAALVNLSLEPKNKVPVVRSGAVPALVDVLVCGHDEARDHAAGALFSLSMDDENKAAIGVLGAVPPLLRLFCRPDEDPRARRDAGMAIHHLCQASTNRTRVIRAAGAVKAVVGVAKEGGDIGRVAMMVLCGLAGSGDGRAAMMDAGAVAAVAAMMRDGSADEAGMEEYCVGAIYGMSRGGVRFRAMAKAAAVEEEMDKVAVKEKASEAVREMARRTARVMLGENDGVGPSSSEGSVVSDGAISFRRRYSLESDGINSAEF